MSGHRYQIRNGQVVDTETGDTIPLPDGVEEGLANGNPYLGSRESQLHDLCAEYNG